MNEQLADLPLRDIHLPEPIGWWPPAPGWWTLLGLLLLLGLLIWIGRRLLRRNHLRKHALRALEQIADEYRRSRDTTLLAHELSVLLRRLALSLYPRPQVASLTGEDWLSTLDRALVTSGREPGFTRGPGRSLLEAPYNPSCQVDAEALLGLTRRWIEAVTTDASGQEAER